MHKLHKDVETQSAIDLTRVGAQRYAEDPSTHILLGSSRLNEGPVVHSGGQLPADTGNLILVAHSAAFERNTINAHHGRIVVTPEMQDCTLARAAALSLPTSLDKCCEVLKAPQQKDKAGKALMMKMCKADYVPKPGERERLQAYCDQDVLAECALDKLLPPLSPRERRVWILDQHINDRGFAIDVPLVAAAQEAVLEAKRLADQQMRKLTDGFVKKCTEAAKICTWLRGRGIPCDSIAEGAVDEILVYTNLLDDPLAAEVVRLRVSASRTFKFPAMLDCVCRDGRIRGTLAYHGTLSGRWAGRLVQPQNMKRVETEDDERVVRSTLETLSAGMDVNHTLEWLSLVHDNPLEALSLCARPMIVAAPGKKLIGGDFSNIEGRINAWLNDEGWKLTAFEDYDAGEGPDLYKVTAGNILGKAPEDVRKEERQIWGKVSELACLGPDTLVITDRGPVPIEDVGFSDKLWDGEAWVVHGGLAHRGLKEMIGFNGLEMTPDHPVLLGEMWCEARTVDSDPHWTRLASVNASASLLSQDFRGGLRGVSGSLLCAVPALTLSTECTSAVLGQADRLAAIVARRSGPGTGSKGSGGTQTLSPMTHIDAACLTESRHVLIAAITLATPDTPTTEAAALKYMNLGEAINELFSHTSKHWKAGTNLALNLIERTLTGGMNRETSDLLHMPRIVRTLERSLSYNSGYTSLRSAFDIAHAGPRNRFMVWGADGPLIVHNCGYQGGVNAFHKMGANYGVSVDGKQAKAIVTGWREQNPGIVAGWADLQQAAIDAVSAPGALVPALGGRIRYRADKGFLWCSLPSGRVLAYPGAIVERKHKIVVIDGEEIEFNNWGVSYWTGNGHWHKEDLYGGRQMAHVVSGTARDILVEAMFRLEEAHYPIVLTVHDETLSEVDSHFGSPEEYQRLMEIREPWFFDVPITAKTWEGYRYAH